ncbi:cytochrome o ubiquinol oxidase subunit IV [Ferroacidibacillus organovorans]|uniref:Cytochrome C oxidase subunit IV n=1 Tax=Ferroacidibacillus organovorans TaxID=1765683 RepID=A0A853K7T6_9BACL|nr:cytochrome C oxidase subunit IV family protein [Ferroacidibacillus organovorans]KYP80016.1 cytochrome C oxidase subunit IV [Ferroacidibacillus organovorans]OAG92992.1 cytochrome C oxidase subunit IV [Ferroacidibacillus organovorans]
MNVESEKVDGGIHPKHSAKKYIVGYLSSLVLTALAYTFALKRSFTLGPLLIVLMVLAGLQIVVQLYFFMHATEGDGPPFHLGALVLGLFFTFAVALMSVWIMGFPAFSARVS